MRCAVVWLEPTTRSLRNCGIVDGRHVGFGGLSRRGSRSALAGDSVRYRSRRAAGFGGLRAVFADMTGLATLVAGLASGIQWSAVWRCAIARYVALDAVISSASPVVRVGHTNLPQA